MGSLFLRGEAYFTGVVQLIICEPRGELRLWLKKTLQNSVLYTACMILSGAGAWFIYRSAFKLGFVDRPNERSSHTAPTPKGGGIGILAAFVLSSFVLRIPLGFWLSASILAIVSFYGDRFPISPKIRFPIQFIAALFLLAPTLFSDFSLTLSLGSQVIWLLFLAVFIVGTANYYNFMDGINGIAGITGVVGFGLLGWFAAVEGADPGIIALCVCLGLACLGFLPFNMPKARVFMGDVGSILLGFVFAGMVVWLSKSVLDFLCLANFLFPFYADELTTLVVRLKDGDKLTKPHRKHLYQLLANERGIAHWKVSVGYGVLQLAPVKCALL